jgi:hypothetical protein
MRLGLNRAPRFLLRFSLTYLEPFSVDSTKNFSLFYRIFILSATFYEFFVKKGVAPVDVLVILRTPFAAPLEFGLYYPEVICVYLPIDVAK